MKQSRGMSLIESVINIVVGFGISVAAQAIFLPLLGVPIPLAANLFFAAIMTVISIARSYALRRLFEALHIRRPMSPFMQAVIAECFRQREVEGYDVAHDDQHDPRELAQAGAAYLLGDERRKVFERDDGVGVSHEISGLNFWPWSFDAWKPREPRRNFVRGCALGIAAGELADRQRKRKKTIAQIEVGGGGGS